jgi:hypothetical protein
VKSQSAARMVTILVLAGAVGMVIARKTDFRSSRASDQSEAKPQDAIYAMLDAARNGDVAGYLSSYTGEMEQALTRAKNDSPDFAKYLRDANAQLKGIAVMEPQPQLDGQIELRVEYVYTDRNEAQFYFLTKTSGGWKISRVETSERVKTIIPYGTPVQ